MSLQLNNKQAFNTLTQDMEAALQTVASKHGITFHTNHAKISYEGHGGECSIKIKVTTDTKPKAAINQAARDLDIYGLPGYLNQQVRTHDGQIFIVKGINNRCRKSPVILEHLNGGRGAKCPVSYILNQCTKVD